MTDNISNDQNTAGASSPIEQQLIEYENQLKDVNELIQLSPDDDSLLSLQNDLIELIKITKQQLVPQSPIIQDNNTNNDATVDDGNDNNNDSSIKRKAGTMESDGKTSFVEVLTEAASAAAAAANSNDHEPNSKASTKKKIKIATTIKEFEIPQHLIPHDTDTDTERNKKRRAIKALKNKWKENKKEMESIQKQQSWQTFLQKKTKNNNNKPSSTIFSTHTGGDTTKVGVVAPARQMTEFGERKRHK